MQLSKDENIKDDAEKSAKVEQDGKPTKERRNRREKVKPLQKVRAKILLREHFLCRHIYFNISLLIISVIGTHNNLDCNS